jgi:hypothetical protein
MTGPRAQSIATVLAAYRSEVSIPRQCRGILTYCDLAGDTVVAHDAGWRFAVDF